MPERHFVLGAAVRLGGALCRISLACAIIFGTAASARADELSIVGVRQDTPGQVVVSVAVDAGSPLDAKASSLSFANGASVPATSVAPSTSVGSLLVCVDQSGSMGGQAVDSLKAGLARVLSDGGRGQAPFRVAIVRFGSQVSRTLDFTRDRHAITAALHSLGAEAGRDGKTHLYDSVATSLRLLGAEHGAPRRLLVISDGKDEGSALTLDQLNAIASAAGIPIDSVAWGHEAGKYGAVLARLSKVTGGQFAAVGEGGKLTGALQGITAKATSGPVEELHFSYTPGGSEPASQATLLVAGKRLPLATPLPAPLPGFSTAPASPSGPYAASAPSSAQPMPTMESTAQTSTGSNMLETLRHMPVTLALAGTAAGLIFLGLVAWALRRGATARSSRNELSAPADGIDPIASPPAERRGRTIVGQADDPSPASAPRRRRHATQVGHEWQAPGPDRPLAILSGVDGAMPGRAYPMARRLVNVGASSDNDLIIDDDYVSGHHAILRFEAGSLLVEDLGSSNGTWLNEDLIRSSARVLSPGDRLRFGRTSFELQTAGVSSE